MATSSRAAGRRGRRRAWPPTWHDASCSPARCTVPRQMSLSRYPPPAWRRSGRVADETWTASGAKAVGLKHGRTPAQPSGFPHAASPVVGAAESQSARRVGLMSRSRTCPKPLRLQGVTSIRGPNHGPAIASVRRTTARSELKRAVPNPLGHPADTTTPDRAGAGAPRPLVRRAGAMRAPNAAD